MIGLSGLPPEDQEQDDDGESWQNTLGPDPIDVAELAPGDVILLGDTHGGPDRHHDHGTGRRVLHVDATPFPAAGLDAKPVPGYAVWHDGLTADVIEPEDGDPDQDPTVMMLWIPADAGHVYGYRCPGAQVFATRVRFTRYPTSTQEAGETAELKSLELELGIPAVVTLTLRPCLDMRPCVDDGAEPAITTMTEISMLVCPSNAPALLPWLGDGPIEALHFTAWTDLSAFARVAGGAAPGTMWGSTSLAGARRAELAVTDDDRATLRWRIFDEDAARTALVLLIDAEPPAFVRDGASDAQKAAGVFGWMGDAWPTPPDYNDESPF